MSMFLIELSNCRRGQLTVRIEPYFPPTAAGENLITERCLHKAVKGSVVNRHVFQAVVKLKHTFPYLPIAQAEKQTWLKEFSLVFAVYKQSSFLVLHLFIVYTLEQCIFSFPRFLRHDRETFLSLHFSSQKT